MIRSERVRRERAEVSGVARPAERPRGGVSDYEVTQKRLSLSRTPAARGGGAAALFRMARGRRN